MKKCIALAGMVLLQFAAAAQQQPFNGISLEPASAYLQTKEGPRRMVRLLFHGGQHRGGGRVELQFNGLHDSVTVPLAKDSVPDWELALPGKAIQHATELQVSYRYEGMTYGARCLVYPARMWRVYLLPHSHVDVGYTNVQEKVLAIHMDNIDEAIRIAEKTAAYPAGARFKWNTEAMWVVDNYLAKADAARRRRFWNAVKKGWINLDAAYGNTNTSATSAAQLLRLFRHGLQLAQAEGVSIHTFFQGDVPGASWGLAAQSDISGIRYFLSAPNASDRIGLSYKWRDKPFYWRSPSGGQKLLFWQCSPYSIGYTLKGSRIPNFFTVENPKPYFTGKPSENFLNPYLFNYLAKLETEGFPYELTLLTWAMSDNAPIDPELPDAVKAWNERYASPQLVITSTREFFAEVEKKYADRLPVLGGDYTEYWTDGIASGAREAALTRNASERLQQAAAIWAIRGDTGYPAGRFNKAWLDAVMFNEHTWGAYNSISHPEDPKALAQWQYKQAFALRADSASHALLQETAAHAPAAGNAVDVYNTTGYTRTALVTVPAALSQAGDQVRDADGRPLPSQRLSTGELAVLVSNMEPFSKRRLLVQPGAAQSKPLATVNGYTLSNGHYTLRLDPNTGNIVHLSSKDLPGNLADSGGINRYVYLPGDSLAAMTGSGEASIRIKERGPLLASVQVVSSAPGADSLVREIRLAAGANQVEVINTIYKKAVSGKESVYFSFPFRLPGAQVRYNIPWGSIRAEADQLPYANRNWYTVQRWVDVSGKDKGITWCSPDAPLFEIGRYPTAGLLGSLGNSLLWRSYTGQQAFLSSWVMNNLWHTNFRRNQPGAVTFRYYLRAHGAYDAAAANAFGIESAQPPVVLPATGAPGAQLFFNIQSTAVYTEQLYPSADGRAVLAQLVNSGEKPARVTLSPAGGAAELQVWESSLLEEKKKGMGSVFEVPGKGVLMIRVERK